MATWNQCKKLYTKKLYLVCINKKYSNNIIKIASKLNDEYKIPVIALNEDIEFLTGITNCQIIGIKNKGLADSILSQASEFEIIKRGE